MTPAWADVGPLIGLYLGAFAIGWAFGLGVLWWRKFMEVAT